MRGYKLAAVTTSSSANTATSLAAVNATAAANGLTCPVTLGSNQATFTATAAHGFVSGQPVLISGANDANFNGYFQVQVVSPTVFTYNMPGIPAASPDPGAPVASTLLVRKWWLTCLVTNTAAITLGPTTSATGITLNPGQFIDMGHVFPSADALPGMIELATWNCKSTSASQPFTILYVPV